LFCQFFIFFLSFQNRLLFNLRLSFLFPTLGDNSEICRIIILSPRFALIYMIIVIFYFNKYIKVVFTKQLFLSHSFYATESLFSNQEIILLLFPTHAVPDGSMCFFQSRYLQKKQIHRGVPGKKHIPPPVVNSLFLPTNAKRIKSFSLFQSFQPIFIRSLVVEYIVSYFCCWLASSLIAKKSCIPLSLNTSQRFQFQHNINQIFLVFHYSIDILVGTWSFIKIVFSS